WINRFLDKFHSNVELDTQWAQALKDSGALLAVARAMFEETQAMAMANGVLIGEDLVARPVRPDTTPAQVAAIQGRVAHCWSVAEEARGRLRAANESLRAQLAQLRTEMEIYVLGSVFAGGAGGRKGPQQMGPRQRIRL